MSPEMRALKRVVKFVLGAIAVGFVGAGMVTLLPPMALAGILVAVGLGYALIALYEIYVSQEKYKDTLK